MSREMVCPNARSSGSPANGSGFRSRSSSDSSPALPLLLPLRWLLALLTEVPVNPKSKSGFAAPPLPLLPLLSTWWLFSPNRSLLPPNAAEVPSLLCTPCSCWDCTPAAAAAAAYLSRCSAVNPSAFNLTLPSALSRTEPGAVSAPCLPALLLLLLDALFDDGGGAPRGRPRRRSVPFRPFPSQDSLFPSTFRTSFGFLPSFIS